MAYLGWAADACSLHVERVAKAAIPVPIESRAGRWAHLEKVFPRPDSCRDQLNAAMCQEGAEVLDGSGDVIARFGFDPAVPLTCVCVVAPIALCIASRVLDRVSVLERWRGNVFRDWPGDGHFLPAARKSMQQQPLEPGIDQVAAAQQTANSM